MYARWLLGTSVVGIMGFVVLVCAKTEILGDISFDFKIPEKKRSTLSESAPASNVTKAEPVECIYQYPESPQVDAMLSNMMNQLTKMFVRVNKYMRSEARREDKRFKVVQEQASPFFDHIYLNMTEEYRRFVNQTRSRVQHEGRDPCAHQGEIRELWRALLDSSQESLRRAALACVEEFLRVSRTDNSGVRGRARSRASQLLRRELAHMRQQQLALLCDNFQLCYNELL